MKLSHKIRNLGRKTKLAVAALTLAVAVAVPFAAQAEFFPNRPTFDYNIAGNGDCSDPANPATQNGRCGSMNGPVFNSFINTPSYGDERSFVDARRSDQTAAGSYKNVLPDVTGGSKEIVVRMYVHNNANGTTNASGLGVARNTKVRVALPNVEGSALRAVGYISADNAAPQVVEDTVDFTSTERFTVGYKAGSAIMYNNGPLNGSKLSDSIVTTGAPIGFDALNGSLPGCFEYEAVVQITLTVTPKENPDLGITKQVRKTVAGQTGNWTEEVTAKPGEQVDWLVNTKNVGTVAMTDVVTRDVLPPHVALVPGSVKFTNANGSQTLNDAPLFGGGFNAGRYDPNDNSLITFTTTLKDDFTACEIRVRNIAFAKAAEFPNESKDNADVVIKKENCQPDEEVPQYKCESLQVTVGANRFAKFTAAASASGGAEIKRYKFTFGDGTPEFVTDKNVVEHTYAKDGQYAARVKVEVMVNNELKIAEGDQCAVALNFTPPTCVDNPNTPGNECAPCVDNPNTAINECVVTPGKPGSLPNTGPGAVVATFVAVTTLSSGAYYFVMRRLSGGF